MKPAPAIVRRVLDAIREARTICVVGHIRPDGDCIGSQLALALALKNEGKRVTVWNEDAVPQKLRFLDTEKMFARPRAGEKFDCVIATDCASFERLGAVREHIGARGIFINIDHHASNTRYADLNWVMPKEPSSGELIYRLLRAANWPVTKPIADCLFTAVSTDTGSFQYPSTRPATYQIAGELVKRGADLAKICDEVYQSYSLQRVRLLRHVYNSFRLSDDNRVAWFWLRQRDFARTGAERNDTEGLIEHIRDIEPVVVACCFEEMEPELVRISLRSKNSRVNVNEIAAHFGGGGHPAAAGARIPGRPATVQRRVIAEIKKALARRG
jgi:bifunctional oligoribonuclease and PAP phosphatase NrnA